MLSTRRNLFGPLVLVGMVLLPAVAFAEGAKVAVVDTVQATLRLKLGIRQAVATALDDLSVAMVPLEDLTTEDAACTDAACFAAIAKRVEATHVMVVQGVANPAGYRLTLDVRDGETGRSLGSDGKDCELCSEDQFVPTVQDKVSKLWTRVMREQAPPSLPAPAVAPLPPPHAMAAVSDTEQPRPGVDTSTIPPWWKQPTPVMGIGFGAVGLLAAGFGIYYITQDGKTVENNPQGKAVILRDTGKWGWSLLGVGAVSLVAGSAMVIWGRDDGTSVSVAVGPSSLGLQGKF
jgi:hypothetical protein